MEIMKITDTSIKITLCESEAREYNLNEECAFDTKEMKKSFAKLLSRAKKEVGFKYAGESVIVEIFSSKDGGYEIFVSYFAKDEKTHKERPMEQRALRQGQNAIFAFDELDGLLTVISKIIKLNLEGKSAAYHEPKTKKYYLIIEGVSKKDPRVAFANEYGSPLKATYLTYVLEYANCIAKGKNLIGLA